MKKYKCPECGELITQLTYRASCSETQYGSSYGTYDIENEETNVNDTNWNDSENFEEDEFEYECPECEACIDSPEDLEVVTIPDPKPIKPPIKNNFF